MARKGWIAIGLSLTFAAACGVHDSKETCFDPAATPASGAAAAVQSNQYKGEGVVKAINPKAPAIEIDHGDIPRTNARDADGISGH